MEPLRSDCGAKLFNPTPAQPSGDAVVEGWKTAHGECALISEVTDIVGWG